MSLFGRKILLQPQYQWTDVVYKWEAGQPTTRTVYFPVGIYQIVLRGGGGAGGQGRPALSTGFSYAARSGGAGAPGYYNAFTVTISRPLTASVWTGSGGTGIGNGGAGGFATLLSDNNQPQFGGYGGDGGWGAIISFNSIGVSVHKAQAFKHADGEILYARYNSGFTGMGLKGANVTLYGSPDDSGGSPSISVVCTCVEPWKTVTAAGRTYTRSYKDDAIIQAASRFYVDGGAGGGGAGGNGVTSYTATGAGGGGGGGRRYLDASMTTISVPGKNGGAGGGWEGAGAPGVSGSGGTGLFSGAGGRGYRGGGGAGASGGGASGGGGGSGKASDSSGGKRSSGGGGGGAPGSNQAGGGQGGGGKSVYGPDPGYADNGFNHFSNPAAVGDPWGNAAALGSWGRGGASDGNGGGAWIRITKIG